MEQSALELSDAEKGAIMQFSIECAESLQRHVLGKCERREVYLGLIALLNSTASYMATAFVNEEDVIAGLVKSAEDRIRKAFEVSNKDATA